jgi:tRNA(Ile)-lysidine synthase TilS/MesJ
MTRQNSIRKITLHWNIIVVHFDHQQSGVESEQDRIMVQTLCHIFQLPCFIFYSSDSNRTDYSNKNNNNSHTTGYESIANTD